MCSLNKSEIVAAFESLQKAGALQMNPSLAGFNEETVPVLETKTEPTLEVIQPKAIIREVSTIII